LTLTGDRQAVRVIPGLSALPWRDPRAVPQEKLQDFIAALQRACSQYADTCLSIAYAMNHDVNRSMDALEGARRIESENLLPQLEYADLHCRSRALENAEAETARALELARTSWKSSLTRSQLAEIRSPRRRGAQKAAWTKWLKLPTIGFVVLPIAISWFFIVSKSSTDFMIDWPLFAGSPVYVFDWFRRVVPR
jgi:hypothetical protein